MNKNAPGSLSKDVVTAALNFSQKCDFLLNKRLLKNKIM